MHSLFVVPGVASSWKSRVAGAAVRHVGGPPVQIMLRLGCFELVVVVMRKETLALSFLGGLYETN